jgi:hypothetical protein
VDSAIFQDPHLWQLWCWILMRANWTANTATVKTGRGNTLVSLSPGQFIFGRNTAARDLRCPPSNIRNRLDFLRRRKMVDIQPDKHYSIVSVLNWELYQGGNDNKGQANGQASGQAKDNQRTQRRSYRSKRNISYTSDFEKFWSVYPRLIGKQIAFTAWLKVIESYPPAEIIAAAEEYAAVCERERREERFILHPSTFLSKDRWKDYYMVEVSGAR